MCRQLYLFDKVVYINSINTCLILGVVTLNNKCFKSCVVGDILQEIADILKYTDADSAEPYWIVCHVLGVSRGALSKSQVLDNNQCNQILCIVEQRKAFIPLDYIFECTNFYGLDLFVNEHVLIPKAETELLAECAIKEIEQNMTNSCNVLDLCTGSGCISVAIATNAKCNLRIVLSDISKEALEVASRNMTNCATSKCLWSVVHSDMFFNIQGKFDIIVSNPPYIAKDQIDSLSTEVRMQPHVALDGGSDGLFFYRIIAQNAKEYLNQGGKLLLEIAYDQGQSVTQLFKEFGYKNIVLKQDLSGNDRIVECTL